MILVAVESPYAGNVERSVAYARAAIADCLRRGEAPFASHLLYTQEGVLDDDVPEQRELGISAGELWADKAKKRVFYIDFGMSSGMCRAMERARFLGQRVEQRTLEGWS